METEYSKKGRKAKGPQLYGNEPEMEERFGSMFYYRANMGKGDQRINQIYGNEYGKEPLTAKERADEADQGGIPVSPLRTMKSI